MKKVGILNAYDVHNRGDRAIVEAQIGWIRSHWPDAEVVVFSSHHRSNEKVFDDVVSAFPVIDAPLASSGLKKLLAPFLRWIEFRLGHRGRREFRLFRECDAFLMCGGGYLYSSPSRFPSRQLAVHCANALLAISTGKPVLPFPQSWGPLRKRFDYWICRRLADRLIRITTRGRKSTELVEAMGFGDRVIEVPDVVMAIRQLRPEFFSNREEQRKEHPSLGISPINWSFERDISKEVWSRYLQGLVRISEDWVTATGGRITIIPQVVVDDHDDDRLVCEELANLLNDAGVAFEYEPDASWQEHWELIGRQSVFLGCRMHSCIFAVVSHVPTVGLAYQPKFHELYGHLGLPELSHEIDQFDPLLVSSQLHELFHDDKTLSGFVEKVDRLSGLVIARMNEAWAATTKGK